jgi:hypothetical protein
MAEALKRNNPTPETVQHMIPGTIGGTFGASNAEAMAVHHVRVPLSDTGGTANAGFVSWVNPERFTIGILDMCIHFHTTGTGTFDMGVSSDGTGSNDTIFNGGTMNTPVGEGLVSVRGGTGTAGVGLTGTLVGVADRLFLGPGGTGTNNSLVAKTSETATTAKGDLHVSYYVTNR